MNTNLCIRTLDFIRSDLSGDPLKGPNPSLGNHWTKLTLYKVDLDTFQHFWNVIFDFRDRSDRRSHEGGAGVLAHSSSTPWNWNKAGIPALLSGCCASFLLLSHSSFFLSPLFLFLKSLVTLCNRAQISHILHSKAVLLKDMFTFCQVYLNQSTVLHPPEPWKCCFPSFR